MLLASDIIKKTCIGLRGEGAQIRCISEISKQNSSQVEKIISMVDNFHHLEGISGSFIITDSYCIIRSITGTKTAKEKNPNHH